MPRISHLIYVCTYYRMTHVILQLVIPYPIPRQCNVIHIILTLNACIENNIFLSFMKMKPLFNISILCKKNSNKYCQKIASIVLQTKHETLPYWQLEWKTIIWKFLEYSLPCSNRLIFRFPYKWKMGKYIWQRGWSLYNLEVVFANVYYVYMHKDVNIYYSS